MNKLIGKAGVLALAVMAVIWVSLRPSLTPQELFQERCTACHILPDMCRFTPQKRAAVVQTMRIQQQAEDVINDTESANIIKYLSEQLACQ
ncbi:MAG TPA: hypothetical protein ENI62_01080 [Gammaproteobacteria bacterium]|nr:hypothetical protein [Gammaproteobacteria bacterium]